MARHSDQVRSGLRHHAPGRPGSRLDHHCLYHNRPCHPVSRTAAHSAMVKTVALVLAETIEAMTEASSTRSPSVPIWPSTANRRRRRVATVTRNHGPGYLQDTVDELGGAERPGGDENSVSCADLGSAAACAPPLTAVGMGMTCHRGVPDDLPAAAPCAQLARAPGPI
jgi:hypothetical protein